MKRYPVKLYIALIEEQGNSYDEYWYYCRIQIHNHSYETPEFKGFEGLQKYMAATYMLAPNDFTDLLENRRTIKC